MFRSCRIWALAMILGSCGCNQIHPQDNSASNAGATYTSPDGGSEDAILSSAREGAKLAQATGDNSGILSQFHDTFTNRLSHLTTWLIVVGMVFGVTGMLVLGTGRGSSG